MGNFEIVPVKCENGKLLILDQTLLPGDEVYIEIKSKEDLWAAIHHLKVRGAPLIGIAAAYGFWMVVKHSDAENYDQLRKEVRQAATYLASARPTAVNLFWALNRMLLRMEDYVGQLSGIDITKSEQPVQKNNQTPQPHKNNQNWQEQRKLIGQKLFREAEKIRTEDEEACLAMGEYGLSLLDKNIGILTHCNAGGLATAKYGTCLAPIYLGHQRGYNFKVFADETRPLLQGARLTAWELQKSGIDTTLICDNMAATIMKKGWVNGILVGCDRMAANGDAANKIGTLGTAILAAEYNIPFYVFVPISTIDMRTETGDDIVIEERSGEEIYKMWYKKPMAPQGIKTYNPSFDVTDHRYITAIITEAGIIGPPYKENLRKLFTGKVTADGI